MQKQELEKMLDAALSEEEYKVIETVYMHYPHISNVWGKVQVSDLYRTFGMAIFYDMHQRAALIRAKRKQLASLEEDISQVNRDIDEFRRGDILEFLGVALPF